MELLVFDLDGTLTRSKAPLDREMASLLCRLLRVLRVAVVGGGTFGTFKEQLLSKLHCPTSSLANLFLFPVTATSAYRYREGWRKVYAEKLNRKQKQAVRRALRLSLARAGYVRPRNTHGVLVEDRGGQVTFSALGQHAPLKLKQVWNQREHGLRARVSILLRRLLPSFTVEVAGLTSIDVTGKKVDKAYGIRKIEKLLGLPRSQMLFVGDALFPGGNDYAVRKTRVPWVAVRGPEDTKKIIRRLLSRV